MPKIGMRTIKTAISVAVCITILQFFENTTAFFACTTAVFSLQSNVPDSWKAGFSRWIGTSIGAVVGFLFALIPISHSPFKTLAISMGIIIVIYLCTLIKHESSVFVACIVFLAIMTSVKEGGAPTYAVIRMLETTLGVVVSIAVNKYVAPVKP